MNVEVRTVVRWALLVLAVTLIFGAAGYAFAALQGVQYEATTRIAFGRLLSPELQLLGPDFGEPDIEEDVRIQTEAALVDSYDVAVATARIGRLDLTPAEVNERIEVTPERGTLIVSVAATGPTAMAAVDLAHNYSQEYITMRSTQERQRAREVLAALEERLAELPRADRQGLRGAALRDQISTVSTLGEVGSGSPQIIEEPRASDVAVEPQIVRNVLFGLLFGLIAGVGLVAALHSRRRLAARRSSRGLATTEPSHQE